MPANHAERPGAKALRKMVEYRPAHINNCVVAQCYFHAIRQIT